MKFMVWFGSCFSAFFILYLVSCFVIWEIITIDPLVFRSIIAFCWLVWLINQADNENNFNP